jgi:hypothetical protein
MSGFTPIDPMTPPADVAPAPRYLVREVPVEQPGIVSDPALYGAYDAVGVWDRETETYVATYPVGESREDMDAAWAAAKSDADRRNA